MLGHQAGIVRTGRVAARRHLDSDRIGRCRAARRHHDDQVGVVGRLSGDIGMRPREAARAGGQRGERRAVAEVPHVLDLRAAPHGHVEGHGAVRGVRAVAGLDRHRDVGTAAAVAGLAGQRHLDLVLAALVVARLGAAGRDGHLVVARHALEAEALAVDEACRPVAAGVDLGERLADLDAVAVVVGGDADLVAAGRVAFDVDADNLPRAVRRGDQRRGIDGDGAGHGDVSPGAQAASVAGFRTLKHRLRWRKHTTDRVQLPPAVRQATLSSVAIHAQPAMLG